MAKDMLDKGAILQRDKETYAVAPHIPGGITTSETLRKIADVADKYQAQALKITSAQRIALVGLQPQDLDAVWEDLGEKPGAALGLCIRSVKICPGTTFCKRGQQDSVNLGLQLDECYHGMELPWKLKMGVSGCANDCAEGCIKDIALIATPKGWNVMIGGNGGGRPRLAHKLVSNVESEAAVLTLVDHLVSWFQQQDKKCRLGKFIENWGWEAFRQEVLAGTEFAGE